MRYLVNGKPGSRSSTVAVPETVLQEIVKRDDHQLLSNKSEVEDLNIVDGEDIDEQRI